jgi:hypothetical protein
MGKKRPKSGKGKIFRDIFLRTKLVLDWLCPPQSAIALLWIALGWVLVFFSILALQDFHPVVKPYFSTGPVTSFGMILLFFVPGSAFLLLGFRRLPEPSRPVETGSRAAFLWLSAILAVTSCLRLYRIGQPLSPFWDDWANSLVAIRPLLDQNKFYWMFPSDGREPFLSYFMVGIRFLLPDLHGLVVQRITSWLLGLLAIFVLYLAGKELGSRRVGLVAAGLGAVGMPMLQLSLAGMRAFTIPLAVSLLLLATFRLFNQPIFSRFLQWGLALAFGVHTYTVFRSFTLVVPFILLPWILYPKTERRFHPFSWLSILYSIPLLVGVFAGTLASTHPGFAFLQEKWEILASRPWGFSVLLIGWALLSGWALWKEKTRLAGWAFAVGLAALVIYPLSRGYGFDERLPGLSAFRRDPMAEQEGIYFLCHKLQMTLSSLFYHCLDRNDLQIVSAPFYDVMSQGMLALGFVYFCARPDWKKLLLLALGFLGTIVYVLSIDPGSTKLIGSAPSFYLLAGLALSRIWEALPRSPRPGRVSPWVLSLAAFLSLYGLWGGWMQWEKLFNVWGVRRFPETTIARQVGLDESAHRVYLAPSSYFFGDHAQFVLNQGRRYYILKEHNAVPVKPGVSPENVVVLLDGSQVPGGNILVIKLLRDQYPGAEWEKIPVEQRAPGDTVPPIFMWRVFIPGTSLSPHRDRLVYRVEDHDQSLRRFYDDDYGWALGAILKEELVSGLGDPLPEVLGQVESLKKFGFNPRVVQFLKNLKVKKTGDYEWSMESFRPIWVRIDGKTLWRENSLELQKKVVKRIHLEKGSHRVEIRMRFNVDYQMPRVIWREVDGTGGGNL